MLALFGIFQAANIVREDLHFTRLQTEISFWGRDDYHPTNAVIQRSNQAMHTLLTGAPKHPAFLYAQANSYAWQAYWAQGQAETRQLSRRAVNLQRKAVAARPAHLFDQAKLAEYIASAEAAGAL